MPSHFNWILAIYAQFHRKFQGQLSLQCGRCYGPNSLGAGMTVSVVCCHPQGDSLDSDQVQSRTELLACIVRRCTWLDITKRISHTAELHKMKSPRSSIELSGYFLRKNLRHVARDPSAACQYTLCASSLQTGVNFGLVLKCVTFRRCASRTYIAFVSGKLTKTTD